MKPEECHRFSSVCKQAAYNEPLMIVFQIFDTVLIHVVTYLIYEPFLATSVICCSPYLMICQNAIPFAELLMRYKAPLICTATFAPPKLTCVYHNHSDATLAGRLLTASTAPERQKVRSNSFVREGLVRDGEIESGFRCNTNHFKKMEMFSSLHYREVIHFPSHLHTNVQVEVALRSYIFRMLFTIFVHGCEHGSTRSKPSTRTVCSELDDH